MKHKIYPLIQEQHTVPEVYLKEFTNEDGKLEEYDLRRKRIQWRYPGQVCKQANFYDITDSSLLQEYKVEVRHIEKSFSRYEKVLVKTYFRK